MEAAPTREAREGLTAERQFRLLREDAIAQLREEYQNLQKPGGYASRALLRNFRIARVVADEKRYWVSVLVRVDLPPRGFKARGMRDFAARKDFWAGPAGAGLLKRDSLVRTPAGCLLLTPSLLRASRADATTAAAAAVAWAVGISSAQVFLMRRKEREESADEEAAAPEEEQWEPVGLATVVRAQGRVRARRVPERSTGALLPSSCC